MSEDIKIDDKIYYYSLEYKLETRKAVLTKNEYNVVFVRNGLFVIDDLHLSTMSIKKNDRISVIQYNNVRIIDWLNDELFKKIYLSIYTKSSKKVVINKLKRGFNKYIDEKLSAYTSFKDVIDWDNLEIKEIV